jgi:uncharacterized protein (TIGR02147 family)
MNIFEFHDYKEFVRKRIASFPRRGYGQYRKLSQALRLSSVAVSQIFKGDRDLSPEHALETAAFLLLDPEEADYFLALVQKARAGTPALRAHVERKLAQAREARATLAKRVEVSAELTDEARAVFYSNWQYSAVRIASSIPGLHGAEVIAKRLGLHVTEVIDVLRFLLKHGLCVMDKGQVKMGPASTFLPNDSPFINGHRRIWRLKSLEHLKLAEDPRNLYYTGLVSLSEEDAQTFRRECADFVAAFVKRVKDSPSETLACMNLDWFRLER